MSVNAIPVIALPTSLSQTNYGVILSLSSTFSRAVLVGFVVGIVTSLLAFAPPIVGYVGAGLIAGLVAGLVAGGLASGV